MTTIQNILKKAEFQPLKRLGQNFLTDKNAVKKIIEAAHLEPTDIILEIGPGTGVLTEELAKRAKKVIAIEKDIKMIEILKETLRGFKNTEVIREDILKLKFQITNSKLQINSEIQIPKSYKVVANLPYYIVSPSIRKFLELIDIRYQPTEMILVVQKEVAQRICAKPPNMNLLAVSVQFYAEPKIISYISKKSFWPSPKVDAAIIKIQIPKSKLKNVDRDLFFKIVKAGFSQPRKQLINNLSKGLKINKIKAGKWLLKNNLQSSQRAETLTIKDWIKLTKTYESLNC